MDAFNFENAGVLNENGVVPFYAPEVSQILMFDRLVRQQEEGLSYCESSAERASFEITIADLIRAREELEGVLDEEGRSDLERLRNHKGE